MRRLSLRLALSACLALAMLTPATAQQTGPSAEDLAASVAPDNDRACTSSMVEVQLQPGTSLTPGDDLGLGLQAVTDAVVGPQQVFVKLCLPVGRNGKVVHTDAVQMLIHGITYDHRYWNIADPADPEGDRYSWEHAATQAGYATLAIDRIGNGASSRPPSTLVDISTNAGVVRSLVTALRAGEIEGQPAPFQQVALVGHSYGSMTSWTAADGFDGVDALVLTGATHNVREVAAPISIESNHRPAILDPLYADSGYDPGYIVSVPGTRYELFYAPSTDLDMRIVGRDEATKGTVSQSELHNYPVIFRTEKDLRAPVLYVIGSLDGIFCSQEEGDLAADCSSPEALIAGERQWLGPDVPRVDATIIPEAGHDLNAFFSSQQTFAAAMGWLADVMPGAEVR